MADESQVPAQSEGAGQPTKKKPAPVNLAMLEAAERGIDLNVTPPPRKKAHTPPPPIHTGIEEQSLQLAPSSPPADPPAHLSETVANSNNPTPDDNSGSRHSAPEDSASDRIAGLSGLSSTEALSNLSESSAQKRLSTREEEHATSLLRSCLSSGDVTAALTAMPKLPWILGVRAIEQAWPELPPEGRADLLASLGALEGDHAFRLRLSVARSLAKVDPPTGVQLAAAVCRAIWSEEKGGLTPEHSKLVGNVFIGRGKPWVLQLQLDGLDPVDATAIVSAVVFSTFNVNNPPITQLSVLRYGASRLAELHPNLQGMVAKAVGRWSGKWQESLRKEISTLPESISSSLRPVRGNTPGQTAGGDTPRLTSNDGNDAVAAESDIPLPPELEEKLKLAAESGDPEALEAATLEANSWRDAHRRLEDPSDEIDAEAAGSEPERRSDKRGRRNKERGDRPERHERKDRPVYVSREQEAASKGQGVFNLAATLKQIENHFAQLRNELSAAQTKLRKVETAPRRNVDKVVLSVEEANLSPDELKRLVLQLEQRNAELQSRVEELLADSETRALATAADSEVTGQYRTLLKLKLQEDYSDYLALEENLPEYVVQQHYRALIRHVFQTLRDEGVALHGDLPPPPPAPLPPPPPPPVVEDEEEEEDSPLDRIEGDAAEERHIGSDVEPDAEPAEVEAEEFSDPDHGPSEEDTEDVTGSDGAPLSDATDDEGERSPEGKS